MLKLLLSVALYIVIVCATGSILGQLRLHKLEALFIISLSGLFWWRLLVTDTIKSFIEETKSKRSN